MTEDWHINISPEARLFFCSVILQLREDICTNNTARLHRHNMNLFIAELSLNFASEYTFLYTHKKSTSVDSTHN